jgi:hypothetical protein
MAGDATYQQGVYRKAGGNILVVDRPGRISISTAGAGTLPTTGTLITHLTSATLTGNDFGGTIVLVTDGTGLAALSGICTVTFGVARTTAPIVNLTNLTFGTGSTTLYAGFYACASVSTTSFVIMNSALLTASGTFSLGYQVIDVE